MNLLIGDVGLLLQSERIESDTLSARITYEEHKLSQLKQRHAHSQGRVAAALHLLKVLGTSESEAMEEGERSKKMKKLQRESDDREAEQAAFAPY